MKKIRVILNGKGAANPQVRAAINQIREEGQPLEVRCTWEGGDAARFAQEAMSDDIDVLVAGGGDRTINEIVNGVFSADTSPSMALGVLPLGTANDFARGCAIPLGPYESLKMLIVIDEYSRECLAIEVARSLRHEQVLAFLAELFITKGVPKHIRSDNGSEFTANEVRKWLGRFGVETLFIQPGSPWEDGYVESFSEKLRDVVLNREIFYTLREAQIIIESWRREYNQIRPHSSLGYRPPAPEAILATPPMGGCLPSWPGNTRRWDQHNEWTKHRGQIMVNTKHEVGKVDLLSVLLMQASVVAARIALFDIRNGQLINRGNLHLALGGTFEQSPEKRVVAGATEEKAGDLVSASSCSKAEITGKILQ